MTPSLGSIARRALAVSALLLVGCASGSSKINRIYQDLQRDVAEADPVKGLGEEGKARNLERADKVREIEKDGGLSTASDYFKAAVLLVETDRPADMELAAALAEKSATMGEPQALRVAAEAIDKQLMLTGKPQKYGTQYVYAWVIESWRLYTTDPSTTDAERAQMGVPTYAELLRKEDDLNRTTGSKLRPR